MKGSITWYRTCNWRLQGYQKVCSSNATVKSGTKSRALLRRDRKKGISGTEFQVGRDNSV